MRCLDTCNADLPIDIMIMYAQKLDEERMVFLEKICRMSGIGESTFVSEGMLSHLHAHDLICV